MSKKNKTILVVFLMMCFVAPAAYADSPLGKLTRGITNIVSSPGEYVNHLGKQVDEQPPLRGFLGTFIYGTYYTCVRLVAGVYETATFLIPIPFHYESVIDPETLF